MIVCGKNCFRGLVFYAEVCYNIKWFVMYNTAG